MDCKDNSMFTLDETSDVEVTSPRGLSVNADLFGVIPAPCEELVPQTAVSTPQGENPPESPGVLADQEPDLLAAATSSPRPDYLAGPFRRIATPNSDAIRGETPEQGMTIYDVLEDLKINATLIQEVEQQLQELLYKQQQLAQLERRLEEQKLCQVLMSPLPSDRGRSVGGLLIFRCCHQWGCFSGEEAPVLDSLVSMMSRQIAEDEAPARINHEQLTHIAYWLAAICTTRSLLHQVYGPNKTTTTATSSRRGAVVGDLQKRIGGMFSRLGRKDTSSSGNPNPCPAEENPAAETGSAITDPPSSTSYRVQFAQSLELLLLRAYTLLRDHIKKRITPLLADCIQGPTEDSRFAEEGTDQEGEEEPGVSPGEEKLMSFRVWCEVVSVFHEYLEVLKAYHVPRCLVQIFFKQVLYYTNVQLFNQLLLRPECCSCSNAKYVMDGVRMLDKWVQEVGPDYVGDAWSQLAHIRQAVQFLVQDPKSSLSLDDITQELCPDLNLQQTYRLCTTFWDDTHAGGNVDGEVLEQLQSRNITNNGGLIVTFLLDEDMQVPFAAAGGVIQEILPGLGAKELLKGLTLPKELSGDDCPPEVFRFLEEDFQVAV